MSPRIERLNPTLNAFITVTAELALEQARQAETEIMAGHWRGPLHGIPIGLKDLLDTAGVRTTAASNQFRDRVPAARRCPGPSVEAGGCSADWQTESARVRVWRQRHRECVWAGEKSVGPGTYYREDLRQVRRQQLRRGFASQRSEPTRRDRFAARRRCAESSDIVPARVC